MNEQIVYVPVSDWKLIGHSYQIADTGDYDGHWEITNGKISLLSNDDDEEELQPIVDALNNSGCKFYQDIPEVFENYILRHDNKELESLLKEKGEQIKELKDALDYANAILRQKHNSIINK